MFKSLSAWQILTMPCLRYLVLALLLLAVNACGYHLRGQLQLDEQYLPVTVEDNGENAEIKPRLIRHLTEANIPVVENNNAHLRILIDNVSFEKHLVSADTTANIDTFDIGVRLRYKFKVDGQDILNWQELRINRTLQFSKSAVVSSATEESTLRDDLLSDAVLQIVTRLRFIDTLVRESKKDEPET